jgi:hypothetical protein
MFIPIVGDDLISSFSFKDHVHALLSFFLAKFVKQIWIFENCPILFHSSFFVLFTLFIDEIEQVESRFFCLSQKIELVLVCLSWFAIFEVKAF